MKSLILFSIVTFLQLNISLASEAKNEVCQQLIGKEFILSIPSNSGLQSVEFRSNDEVLTITTYGVLGNWTCEQIENSEDLGIHLNVQGWDTYVTYSQNPSPHLRLNKGVDLSFEYILK
ncbi:MAG TPA: hypothetical protein VN132_12975 [Bdellovibrio sp.]|nr:hypothetical protein [Bdellovibrio sp.]